MSGYCRAGCKTIFTCSVLIVAMGLARAQTVRPVIVQYGGPAQGKVELVNNALQPLSVVLEPMSFTITPDGNGVYGPLSADIHLKLSAMSFRIPPRQSRFVFYEAKPDKLPAWFVIYSVFAGRPSQSGINVQLRLPHTVYILQKRPLEKQDVTIKSADFVPQKHKVIIVLANNSTKLGRAQEWQIGGKATKIVNPGFPLLPQSERRLELEWNSPTPPDGFLVRFEHFTVQEELHVKRE